MADRSMLFAARATPQRSGEAVNVQGLGEYGYGIPTIYKILVSADPQPCPSLIFDSDTPVAVAGSRAGGLARLRALRARLSGGAAGAASFDEAIAYLSKPHLDHPYFILEPGEILGLSRKPIDEQMSALLADIRSLDDNQLIQLAEHSDDAEHWAAESWTDILYFEPAGSERAPLDADTGLLTTTPKQVVANCDVFPTCRALFSVHLEIDRDDAFAEALVVLGTIPQPFTLNLVGRCEHLPDTAARLGNVRWLVLGETGLRSLPDSLAALRNLEGLFLQTNGLDAPPSGLRGLRQLKLLSLSQNPLQTLPDWIGELEGLEQLWLDECRLRSLPDSFWSLRNLKNLNLSANPELGALPKDLGKLAALEELIAYDSGLRVLPSEICKLSALRTLFVGKNKLTELPRCLYDMPLETLSLIGNPMKKPSWFGGGPKLRAKTVHWK
jgi:hypothetical protein